MATKNNIPDRVTVLGISYQVQLVPKIDPEESAGETNSESRIIKVADYQDTRRRWTTLLHEYLHATLAVVGVSSVLDSELEEVIVQSMEHSLEQFLLEHGRDVLRALEAMK
jgi:hypothetical protein